MAESGFSVHLYGVEAAGATSSLKHLDLHSMKKRRRVSRILNILFLYKEIQKYKDPIVHLHDPELLLLTLFKKRNKDITFIYDMHEHFPSTLRTKEWLPGTIRRPLSWFCSRLEKAAIKKCTIVVFAESYYASYYRDTPVKQLNILNYPLNTVNERIIFNQSAPIRLVYAGAISISRGFKEMLFIAEQLARAQVPFKLSIIGRIPKELSEWAEEFVRFHRLNENVFFHGRLPYEEVERLYRKSDVGLCLLHPEDNYVQSMATKIYEYMQYSLPVLASDFPNWKELIHGSKCGFTGSPLHIGWVVEAVKKLDTNREMLRRLGTNGYRTCSTYYQWDTEAEKLVGLYERLMEGEEECESPVSSSAL